MEDYENLKEKGNEILKLNQILEKNLNGVKKINQNITKEGTVINTNLAVKLIEKAEQNDKDVQELIEIIKDYMEETNNFRKYVTIKIEKYERKKEKLKYYLDDEFKEVVEEINNITDLESLMKTNEELVTKSVLKFLSYVKLQMQLKKQISEVSMQHKKIQKVCQSSIEYLKWNNNTLKKQIEKL